MVRVVALQTARNGSTGVKRKNNYEVKGKPLFLHNLINLTNSKYIKSIYFSTDIPEAKYYTDIGYELIDRPYNLSLNSSNHYDVIRHGVDYILKKQDFDYIVITLGNSLGAIAEDVDKSIEFLNNNSDYDSCESVSEHDYHTPLRAYHIINDEIVPVVNYTNIKNSNDRKALGSIYFFNGSFFTIRKEVILANNGIPPFTWRGAKIKPIIQPQYYTELDSEWQKIIFKYHEFQ